MFASKQTSMARLGDLDDDCLLKVFNWLSPEQLFKMLGVNKRLNRLATEKMRTKIKAIVFGRDFNSNECSHLGAISQNQVLFLGSSFLGAGAYMDMAQALGKPSTRALFLNLLTRCGGVKSIDFGKDFNQFFLLPSGLLFEVIRRCPEIECLKLDKSCATEDEWEQVFDLIGHQIIHFAKSWFIKDPSESIEHPASLSSEVRLLEKIAEKCLNIKRLDCVRDGYLESDLVAAFKFLPKSCWVSLLCGDLKFDILEDVDELDIMCEVDLSKFSYRVDRLSSLKFCVFELRPGDGPVHGVEFTGLKRLELREGQRYNNYEYNFDSIKCLASSRFPLLEKLIFDATAGLIEDDYKGILEKMASVKKLIITWGLGAPKAGGFRPRLPESSIHQLKNLETIHLKIDSVTDIWEPKHFVQQVEQYVDEISSLKKLVVDIKRQRFDGDKWEKTVKEEVKRMQVKQNRVEVVLLSKN